MVVNMPQLSSELFPTPPRKNGGGCSIDPIQLFFFVTYLDDFFTSQDISDSYN